MKRRRGRVSGFVLHQQPDNGQSGSIKAVSLPCSDEIETPRNATSACGVILDMPADRRGSAANEVFTPDELEARIEGHARRIRADLERLGLLNDE